MIKHTTLLLFVLLAFSIPVLAQDAAPLNVRIEPAPDPADSKVVATGRASTPVTAAVRSAFGLTPNAIAEAFKHGGADGLSTGTNYSYGWCASPNPGTGNPRPAMVATTPLRVSPVSVSFSPVIVSHVVWDNANGTGSRHFESTLSTSVQRTVSTSWSASKTVSLSVTVNTGIEAGGVSAGAATTLETSSTYEHGSENSQTVDVGSESSISGDLEPGVCNVAALTASRGTISADVTYAARLSGSCVAVTYWHHHGFAGTKKSRTWSEWDVGSVLAQMGRENAATATQSVAADFYSDAKLATYSLPSCNKDPENVARVVLAAVGG